MYSLFTPNDLYMFALEGNADHVYTIIEDSFSDDPELTDIAIKYENAEIEDGDFCCQIVQNLEKTMQPI